MNSHPTLEHFCSLCAAAEMRTYSRNIFDAVVVTLGVLEVCSFPGLDFRAVLVFRVFRCVRIIRILRSLRLLQLMLGVLSRSPPVCENVRWA